jgi:hypothetical protein
MLVNEIADKFLLKTLWIWLPFRAAYKLIKEYREKNIH